MWGLSKLNQRFNRVSLEIKGLRTRSHRNNRTLFAGPNMKYNFARNCSQGRPADVLKILEDLIDCKQELVFTTSQRV